MNINVQGVHELASETSHKIAELQTDGHLDKIRSWLSPPDPSTNFNKARAQHHGNTGQWFLEGEAYSEWKRGANSFLWLNGIPGCGKTILSSSVVADLEQSAAASSSLIYFYFDFNDTLKQSLENAVRSLVAQLYHKRRLVRAEVDTLYSSCDNGTRQPGIPELCKLFKQTLQQAGEVWIVLDALDESSTRNNSVADGLLAWIEDLRNSEWNIHILATSRPVTDIKLAVESWARNEEIVLLRSELIENDIESYVQARTKQMRRWKDRPDMQKEIETCLTQKANGMYVAVLSVLHIYTLSAVC